MEVNGSPGVFLFYFKNFIKVGLKEVTLYIRILKQELRLMITAHALKLMITVGDTEKDESAGLTVCI